MVAAVLGITIIEAFEKECSVSIRQGAEFVRREAHSINDLHRLLYNALVAVAAVQQIFPDAILQILDAGIDAHREYPAYVLNHDVIKPIVNFPEISMWGLYPWGGFGANPLPRRFQRIWDSSKRVLQGGMPYSEGLYEDIHKIQFAGYYWDPDKNYREILAEYIRYEYSPDVTEQVLQIMELIEQNHVAGDDGTPIDLSVAYRARELAREVDGVLSDRAKAAWRWRVLYIRTLLDVKRYEFYCARNMGGEDDRWTLRRRSAKFLERDEEAQTLMRELCAIYHTVDYNGENRWTHPPVNGGDKEDTLKVQLKEIDG